jgi:hypothetical protein
MEGRAQRRIKALDVLIDNVDDLVSVVVALNLREECDS